MNSLLLPSTPQSEPPESLMRDTAPKKPKTVENSQSQQQKQQRKPRKSQLNLQLLGKYKASQKLGGGAVRLTRTSLCLAEHSHFLKAAPWETYRSVTMFSAGP